MAAFRSDRMISRDDCARRDAADALAPLRDQFMLPEGVIYVDGNSLGALPRATPARVAAAGQQGGGDGLIGSWKDAGWITLSHPLGWTLELLEPPAIVERLASGRGADVAVLMLTQVNYRTGALHDMAAM